MDEQHEPVESKVEIQQPAGEVPELPSELSVEEARERYGISKSCLYSWLGATRIKALRRGRFAYFDSSQIKCFDLLKAHLEDGGKFDNFQVPEGTSGLIVNDDDDALVLSEGAAIEKTTQRKKTKPINNTARGLDTQRVKQAGEIYATEEQLARIYAQKILENPHLLPENYQREIDQFQATLDAALEDPHKKAGNEIGRELLNLS